MYLYVPHKLSCSMFKRIKDFYWRFLKSPSEQAKHLGVTIGSNCFIDTRFWGEEPYLISIGNNACISSGVRLHTHGGAQVARRLYPNFDVFGKIIIEDWVYVGAGAQIMPGVTIGEGSMVAAGSIVTKSVPPGVVVAGVPAKIVCNVEDYINRNLPYNLNSKGLDAFSKKRILLGLPDDKFIKK